jgi:hypothetical protein|tara:strand:- start:415 stop:696 length:282 start_codon:yes stop_codon:yes gene_type:complete
MAELKKIDDQIITRQIPIRKLSDWGWDKNFNTLEEAAEFLLAYAADLTPMAKDCIKRLETKERIIQQLTNQIKSLKYKLRRNITNEKNQDRQI